MRLSRVDPSGQVSVDLGLRPGIFVGSSLPSTYVSTWLNRRASLSGTVLVSDTFTRADSSTSLGNADTGQAWSALQGTWGISSNQGYRTTTVDGDIAVLDAGAADQLVACTIANFGGGSGYPGVLARVTDINNFYLLQAQQGTANVELYKRVAGTYTQLGSTTNTGATHVNGDIISLQASGTSIKVFKNGTQWISVTDSGLTTGSKAGLRYGSLNAAGRFDNFTVTVP